MIRSIITLSLMTLIITSQHYRLNCGVQLIFSLFLGMPNALQLGVVRLNVVATYLYHKMELFLCIFV
jgi:hypothetical protein